MFQEKKRLLFITSPFGAVIDLPFFLHIKEKDPLVETIHEISRHLRFISYSNEKLMYISTDDINLDQIPIYSVREAIFKFLQETFASKPIPFSILLKSSFLLTEGFSLILSDLKDIDIIFYQIQSSEELCRLSLKMTKLKTQISYYMYKRHIKFIRFQQTPVKWKSIKVHFNANDNLNEKIIPEVISLWKIFPQDVVPNFK